MAKVYVSSTFLDLRECREKVRNLLRRMGHQDVAMEYYVAGDQRPLEKCLADVAASDLYVGIFAWRYGYVPEDGNPERLSITEMEYRKAREEGKTCLIFLLSEDAPWPRKFMDRDSEYIDRLRGELGAKHLAGMFTSAEDIGEAVGPAIYKWAEGQGHLPPRVTIPELDLTAYFAALTRRYQRLDLDALTPPQKEEYLQIQLGSVYVEQSVRENPPPVELPKEVWDKLQRDREIHTDDLPSGVTPEDVLRARESYFEKPSRLVLEALADPRVQRCIVLGDPGAGKSTLSRYVLLSLIGDAGDEKLRRAFEGYLPLMIELRSFMGFYTRDEGITFLEFLDALGRNEGWKLDVAALKHFLETDGRAVVIFDGLDEIFDPECREQVARRIAAFASEHPRSRVIATSRVIGYRRKILTDAGFAHFTLQDLDEGQVGAFADRWYSLALSDRPEESAARRERITRAFRESASIRQLAGNPMLLTIMAIIGKNQELPRERWKLYDHAASVLIHHWDVERHLKNRSVPAPFIGEEEKKEMLRRLAFKMQGGAGGLSGNHIHQDELQKEFETYLTDRFGQTPADATTIARAMIEQFRERNFILSLYGASLYGFVHRAFLEYFCASAFVNKFEKTKEISLDQLKRDVYAAHYTDRSWHEVLRLICGMIDEKFAGELITYLVDEVNRPWPEEFGDNLPWNISLAAQCLSEIRNLGTVAEPARSALEAICSLLDHIVMSEWGLDDFIEEQIVPVADTIGPNWPHREVLTGWLSKYKSPVDIRFYTSSLGRFVALVGGGHGELYQVLLDLTTHGGLMIRYMVPFILAEGWREEARTLQTLRHLILEDSSPYIRTAAINALAEHFRDAKTLLVLRECAVADANEMVRRAAIRALAQHFRDDSGTLPLLRELAQQSAMADVRATALRALGDYFWDENWVLALIEDRAVNDESPSADAPSYEYCVRESAIIALAEHWALHSNTLPILRERAKNDPTPWLRERAEELVEAVEGMIRGAEKESGDDG